MTRWILLGLTLIGFTLVFTTPSAGVLALGLLLSVVGLLGFILSLAADRIAANARPDASMASPEDLIALGKRSQRSASPPTAAPSSTSGAGRPAANGNAERESG